MRKTIILCDKCGKEIEKNPARLVIEHVDRSTGETVDDTYKDENTPKEEYCEECIKSMLRFMKKAEYCDECKKGMRVQMERTETAAGDKPAVNEGSDPWRDVIEKDKKPEQKEQDKLASKKQKKTKKEPEKRTPLDHGKIMALKDAGWDDAKIADELGTTKNTIAVIVCKERKKRKLTAEDAIKGGKNSEGYHDPTATVAVGRAKK